MPGIDGLVRFRGWTQKQSHEKDVDNAHKGIGLIIYLAQVITPAPDLTVQVSGAVNFVDETFTLSVSGGDLVIPKHERLAVGDIVAICPLSGTHRWLVICVTSDDIYVPPANNAKFGFNGDKASSHFVGVEVAVPDGDLIGTVVVYGDTIQLTSYGGAAVFIDGVNFKGHVHTDPQGGNTGGPH